MDKMFSTSEFANLFNISRQTLIFYDKKGLFRPAFRNPENDYRMYSQNQLGQFSFIMYLRNIGFSIEQIKTMMSGSADQTMEALRQQSEQLKKQYLEIFNVDAIIQRKINFVQQKLKSLDVESCEIKTLGRQAFVPIGHENILYENKIFYHFPTIAFYRCDNGRYVKFFGAYLDSDEFTHEFEGQVRYLQEQEVLCCYHQGPYEEIMTTLARVRAQHKDLPLSQNFLCINVVDQFLEKNAQNFITEIQIPIQKSDSRLDCIAAI